jgi:hypothetical protein
MMAGRQGFEPRYRGPESGAGIPVRFGSLWFAPVSLITDSVRFGPCRCAPVQNVSLCLTLKSQQRSPERHRVPEYVHGTRHQLLNA